MKTRIMRCMGIAALLGLALGAGKAGAVDFIDGTITVTPVATLGLGLSPASYAFGSLDINTSSNSATALTLTNSGGVSVTVDKKIQTDPGGWQAVVSTGAANKYTLYCATDTARVGLAAFGANTKFGAVGASSNLTNFLGATDPIIDPAGTVDLWFRLDMPVTVSNQNPQTITVRFTAVPQ